VGHLPRGRTPWARAVHGNPGRSCDFPPLRLQVQLGAKPFDLQTQGLIFGFLTPQVGAGESELGLDTGGIEKIQVSEFVVGAQEVVDLDEALVDQGAER